MGINENMISFLPAVHPPSLEQLSEIERARAQKRLALALTVPLPPEVASDNLALELSAVQVKAAWEAEFRATREAKSEAAREAGNAEQPVTPPDSPQQKVHTWDDETNTLTSSEHVVGAAICCAETGAACSSKGIAVSPTEALHIIACFDDSSKLHSEGVSISGETYSPLRGFSGYYAGDLESGNMELSNTSRGCHGVSIFKVAKFVVITKHAADARIKSFNITEEYSQDLAKRY
jgi:hypothetical protein